MTRNRLEGDGAFTLRGRNPRRPQAGPGGHGGDGAGLCVQIAYDIQIYDSVFASNTTGGGGDGSMIGGYGGNGAGVYIESATGPVIIRGSRFEDNLTGFDATESG